jgi:CheY-like chemotaxis protein
MESPRQTLLVSTVPLRLRVLVNWLSEEGHCVVCAQDFAAASQRLRTGRFKLLISDIKLGAYNGLQLVIWSRASHLDTKALLVGDHDPVLQREAERERSGYLTLPLEKESFLLHVKAKLDWCGAARRSPRKRAELQAVVNGYSADIIDLSQGGLCLVIRSSGPIPVASTMSFRLPAFGFVGRVRRVWSHGASLDGSCTCGVALMEGPEEVTAWKAIVDAVPDLSLQSSFSG